MRIGCFACLSVMTVAALASAPDPSTIAEANAEAMRAFQDKKFGLFVHWGVYSLLGKGESVMENDKLPVSEYEKLPPRFNPNDFDAEAWVKTAKAAGMKYITVTAKHHDGFCLFDSKLTRYDVVDATPYGKDPLKALADSCRKHQITLFFYYSLLDWHHPDYFPLGRTGKTSGREPRGEWAKYVAYYQGQIRELCTNYGEIGGIWLAGSWDRPDAPWDLESTYAMIHTLQPKALVGNNHHRAPMVGEDFQIFEKDLPGMNSSGVNQVPPNPKLPLEACESMNRSWGYHASDHADKTSAELIRLLVNAAGRNANLLLNVGPNPDGSLPKVATERLAEVGRWLETNGNSIYGTRGGPVSPGPWGVSTTSIVDQPVPVVYLHVLGGKAPVILPDSLRTYQARMNGGGNPSLPLISKQGGNSVLTVPESERSPVDTVIVLSPSIFDRKIPVRRREER